MRSHSPEDLKQDLGPGMFHLETLKPLKTILKDRPFYKEKYEINDVTLLEKNNWMTASQVSFGMKLIQQEFKNCNILTASPFLNYNALDNFLIDEKGQLTSFCQL